MTTRERAVYRCLMVVAVASVVLFYGWWLRPQHVPGNFTGRLHVLDVLLFATLTGVLSHRIFMDAYVWVVARQIRPSRAEPPFPPRDLRVAFITTFVPGSEGLDLLTRTLPAMLEADYPHDVWLLDEGGDAEARALCEDLGVHYFTRSWIRRYNRAHGPFTRRTKGGNHNSWYDRHGREYDIVAQIDTDFIPRRDFLTQTLGYFRDRSIGWVITPQIYGNTDTFITRAAAQQQFTFYGPVLRGLSGRRMANMLGANHVVRVAALQEIGWYAGHITEDLLTGMRLHARGWRSVYVPLPLAVGEGPDTWKAYFAQQLRWAYGCMDVLRHESLRLVRTMPRSRALLYLSLQQGYFSGLASAVGTGLLVMFFIGGVQISELSLPELVVFGGPLFLTRQVIRLWMQRFFVRPDTERGLHLSAGLISIAVWPVYVLAFVKVALSRPLVFQVTPKGKVSKSRTSNASLFRPHLWWCLISAACLLAIPLTDRWSSVLGAWAALNVVTLGGLYLFVVPAWTVWATWLADFRDRVLALRPVWSWRRAPSPAPVLASVSVLPVRPAYHGTDRTIDLTVFDGPEPLLDQGVATGTHGHSR